MVPNYSRKHIRKRTDKNLCQFRGRKHLITRFIILTTNCLHYHQDQHQNISKYVNFNFL